MIQNLKLTNVYQRTVDASDKYRIILHEGVLGALVKTPRLECLMES